MAVSSSRPSSVEIRLLGPLEVLRDGRPVAVSGDRQRTLLAVLAMSGGQSVSMDAISAAVWEADTPDNVRRSLHTYVARLRRLLGNGVIVTVPGGYRLDVKPDQVDVLRFLRLTGQSAAAPAALREALALWRGRPFENIRSASLAHFESPRLQERFLTATEQRVDLDIAAGRFERLAAELRELIGRHPLRESLWVRLLTVLDLTGREAEALESYQAIRARLGSELGVDPGRDLQRIHSNLLATDAGGEFAAVPHQLPSDTDRFTGRVEALEALDDLIPVGDGQVVRPIVIAAVHGTGGVGKTALAVHWAHRVRHRFPDGQLFVNLRGFGPGEPVTPSAALDLLLRGVNVPAEQIPADTDGRSAMMRSVLADRRMLIVLDNARDASQVRPLLPGSSSLVVITSRSQLRGLVVRDGAHRIALDQLSPTESMALLSSVLPRQQTPCDELALAELAELCGHLPLALRMAAEYAVRHPETKLVDVVEELRDRQSRLDVLGTGDRSGNLRAVFSWSYQTLDGEAARMFRLLGLHPGPVISLPAAAALAGTTSAQARGLLDRLVNAHLVEQRHPHRYEQHDLVRVYATELASAVDAAADCEATLRRVFSFYICSGRNGRAVLGRAEPLGDIEPPYDDVTPLEFDDDRQALAWFDTMRQTTTAAVRTAAERGLDRPAYELSQMLSMAFYYFRATRDLVPVQESALSCARRSGHRLAEAICTRELGGTYAELLDYPRAVKLLERALTLFDHTGCAPGKADVLEALGTSYRETGRFAEAVDHFEQCLAIVRQVGDQKTEGRKLNNLAMTYVDLGRHKDAVAAGQRALELCRGVNRVLEACVWDTLGVAQAGLRNWDDAIVCYQRAITLSRELGDKLNEAAALTNLARAQQAAGQPDRASQNGRLALETLDEIGLTDSADLHRADIVELLTTLGA